jgi:hypothetical protein
MTNEDLIKIGFIETPHFTITNSVTYDIGRRRYLSAGCIGTPNEMLWICERSGEDETKVNDLVCIHNYDYEFIDTYETMKPYLNKIDYYLKNDLVNLSLLEDIRVILNKENIDSLSNYFKDYSIQQNKIYVNNENIIFLKKANILCINSGDFPLHFEMK